MDYPHNNKVCLYIFLCVIPIPKQYIYIFIEAVKEADKVIVSTTNIIRNVNKLFNEAKEELDNKTHITSGVYANNKYYSLIKQFQDNLVKFEAASAKFKFTAEEDFERHVKIIHPQVTQLQVQEMIRNRSASEYLQTNIMAISPDLLEDINELENEHLRVKRIEKTMGDINKLMNACQILVNDNQSKIENIANQVELTKNAAIKGKKRLKQAEIYINRTRKHRIFHLIFCFILFTLISLFGYLFFIKYLK